MLEPLAALAAFAAIFAVAALRHVPVGIVMLAAACGVGISVANMTLAEVLDSLEEGMAVLDRAGRITLWNEALERIVGCARERALGSPLLSAVPGLGNTALPRTLAEVVPFGRQGIGERPEAARAARRRPAASAPKSRSTTRKPMNCLASHSFRSAIVSSSSSRAIFDADCGPCFSADCCFCCSSGPR